MDEGREATSQWNDDPLRLPEGLFPWTVTVYDVAGNAAAPKQHRRGLAPADPVAIRTLNISTASVTEQGSNNSNNNPRRRRPGRVGDPVPLAAPVGRPEVEAGPCLQERPGPASTTRRYRFTGRLTCVINGKRQSAPKRTKVRPLNKVGKKTVRKPNTAIRAKGAVQTSSWPSSSDADGDLPLHQREGQKSEVKIKVRVTKKKQ